MEQKANWFVGSFGPRVQKVGSLSAIFAFQLRFRLKRMSAFGDPLIPLSGFILAGQPLFLANKGNSCELVTYSFVRVLEPTTVDCERLDSSSSGIQYVPMHVETTKQSHCLCGTCHVVLATKIFLLFYSLITILGLCFGMVSAMVWIMIPIGVIFFTVYGFYKQKHKYFYPFLIISVVQLIVCLIMSFIIALFAIFNYDTLKMIIAYNLDAEPTAGLVFVVVGSTVVGCCVLAVIHVWQVVVIYSCLQFYEFDLLQPDRPEISQQRQTQTAPAVCGDQQSKVVVPKRERSHCPTTDFMA